MIARILIRFRAGSVKFPNDKIGKPPRHTYLGTP